MKTITEEKIALQSKMRQFDPEQIKKDFPLLNKSPNRRDGNPEKRVIYLDNAATTQKPVQVIHALQDYYQNYNANVHRGIYRISEQATVAYELAHTKVADFIHCLQQEMIFTKNTTESINLLAYSFQNSSLLKTGLMQFKSGDEILLTEMEHHSNLVPWQQLARRLGLRLQYMKVDKQGRLIIDEKLFTDKTKIVAVTHASNVLGTINNVKEISRLAHEKNAIVVVDAAQSVPHFPVDVRKLGCDFLAFSGHKMLAATGIGCLFGKRELLEQMEPFLFGGDMIRTVALQQSSWNDLPMKFEAGTPPIAEAISMSAAVDYLNRLGMENVRKHEMKLIDYTLDQLQQLKDVTIYGPNNSRERTGVISFTIGKIHPHDVATILDKYNIAIRAGNHCAMPLMKALGVGATCRASFYVYNTIADVDKLVKALEQAKKVFT